MRDNNTGKNPIESDQQRNYRAMLAAAAEIGMTDEEHALLNNRDRTPHEPIQFD